MRNRSRLWSFFAVSALGAVALAACSSGSWPSVSSTHSGSPALGTSALPASSRPAYLVYWDQNEEEDFLSMPSGRQGQLVPPWDANGQMCVLRDGSFVVGYDPTLPAQRNLGSAKPYKQPADGEELDSANGAFSGQTLYVPGPFKMPGQSIGSDSPPTANGVFNNNQTYTGCVVEANGDVFANDIATAQGQYPPPTSGRLVEWFAPDYKTYCIVYGPDAGGTGPHHTDGTGGLAQPGMMALADNGDLLVPNAGTSSVLRFALSSMPTSASQCPGGIYPRSSVQMSTFVSHLSFPAGIAKDPTCGCFAISSYIGNPSIIWVNTEGQPEPGREPLPGETISQLGTDANAYNPFGMAFAPDGTLYFIDIHVACKDNNIADGCGPANYGGRVMKVTFTDGKPSTPTVILDGLDFPTSVTICLPAHATCPYPTGTIHAPLSGPSENPAPDRGPSSDRPATAGFG